MQEQTRADAWAELLRNTILPLVGISALYAVLIWILVQIFKRPLVESLIWVGAVGMFLQVVFVAANWLRCRRTAGILLMDCGPLPMRALYVVGAALMLVNTGFSISDFGIRLSAAVWMLLGCYFIFLAFDHIQIREQGIWHSLNLVKWERIQAYRWEGSELVLQVETFFSKILGPRRNCLQIPNEHREGVDEILGRHVFSAGPSI